MPKQQPTSLPRSASQPAMGAMVGPDVAVLLLLPVWCSPCVELRARRLLDGGIVGVVFDMDGTLTLPGQIDFHAIRRALGIEPGRRRRWCLAYGGGRLTSMRGPTV